MPHRSVLKLLHSHTVPCINRELGPLSPQIICSSKCFAILYAVTTSLLKGKAIMEVADDSIHFKPAQISAGGIAQWQSIRLQIERSPVQLRLPPAFFESRVHSNELLRLQNVLILTMKTRICVVYKEDHATIAWTGLLRECCHVGTENTPRGYSMLHTT